VFKVDVGNKLFPVFDWVILHLILLRMKSPFL